MIGGRGRRSAVSSSGPGYETERIEAGNEYKTVVRGWLSELEIENIFFSVSGNLFLKTWWPMPLFLDFYFTCWWYKHILCYILPLGVGWMSVGSVWLAAWVGTEWMSFVFRSRIRAYNFVEVSGHILESSET